MGLRDYLRLVRRHLRLIAAIAVLCATAALVTSLASTPVYQADAKLLVLAKSAPAGGTASAYEGALLSQQLVESLVQVLQSRPIAEAALRTTPAPISAATLQRRTHASAIPETLLIKLSVTDTERRRAQRLAGAVANAFIGGLRSLQNGATVRVSLVEPPELPSAPVMPRTRLNVALGLLLGLIVGTGLALLREFLDRRVRSPERLEAGAAPHLRPAGAGRHHHGPAAAGRRRRRPAAPRAGLAGRAHRRAAADQPGGAARLAPHGRAGPVATAARRCRPAGLPADPAGHRPDGGGAVGGRGAAGGARRSDHHRPGPGGHRRLRQGRRHGVRHDPERQRRVRGPAAHRVRGLLLLPGPFRRRRPVRAPHHAPEAPAHRVHDRRRREARGVRVLVVG